MLRKSLGLGQQHAATLIATRPSNWSAYETGRLQPGAVVAERIDRMRRLSPTSAFVTDRGLLTIAALTVRIKAALSEGDDHWALRLVAQFMSDVRGLNEPADWGLAFARPSTTGDLHWDALVAAVAERECNRRAVPPPRWCTDPATRLRRFWLYGGLEGTFAYALVHSAPEFRNRGVLLDTAELESV